MELLKELKLVETQKQATKKLAMLYLLLMKFIMNGRKFIVVVLLLILLQPVLIKYPQLTQLQLISFMMLEK